MLIAVFEFKDGEERVFKFPDIVRGVRNASGRPIKVTIQIVGKTPHFDLYKKLPGWLYTEIRYALDAESRAYENHIIIEDKADQWINFTVQKVANSQVVNRAQ